MDVDSRAEVDPALQEASAPAKQGGMMLFETVPNYSVGAESPDVVSALESSFVQAGCVVADVHSDSTHGRTVITVFGGESQIRKGHLAAMKVAMDSINVTRHRGVHPRVGACDVLPIVPLDVFDSARGGDESSACDLARQIAGEFARELGVPSLAYGKLGGPANAGAYRLKSKIGVSDSSSSGDPYLESLSQRFAKGDVTPMAGDASIHPTAGAVCVGVRDVLVAFNVNVVGITEEAAKEVARLIRMRDGGLAGVRALAFQTHDETWQISTNIEQWENVGPARVFDEICANVANVAMCAQDSNKPIVESCEVIGLMPQAAWNHLKRAVSGTGASIHASDEPVIERFLD